jgi:5-methylcytosine-specific restriction endonuclease McrA
MARYPKRKKQRHYPYKKQKQNYKSHPTKPVNVSKPQEPAKKYRKKKIPLAVRQSVWVKQFGRVFQHKCFVSWCHRILSCFDFEVGHNIPESKGGTLDLDNLYPICHQCNTGMGNQYTILDWSNRRFNK